MSPLLEAITPTKDQITLLFHTLGLQPRQTLNPGRARNHIVVSCQGWGYESLKGLVSAGWMTQREVTLEHWMSGGREYPAVIFRVTDEALPMVRALHAATIPKRSRARLRYLRWLDEDGCRSFGEFLKDEHGCGGPGLAPDESVYSLGAVYPWSGSTGSW